jgi:hypothetical protein
MPFHSDFSLSQPRLRFGSFNHLPLHLGHLFLLRCATTLLAPFSAIGVTAQASFVHAPLLRASQDSLSCPKVRLFSQV